MPPRRRAAEADGVQPRAKRARGGEGVVTKGVLWITRERPEEAVKVRVESEDEEGCSVHDVLSACLNHFRFEGAEDKPLVSELCLRDKEGVVLDNRTQLADLLQRGLGSADHPLAVVMRDTIPPVRGGGSRVQRQEDAHGAGRVEAEASGAQQRSTSGGAPLAGVYIRIYVKDPVGRTHILRVNSSSTISDIKAKLESEGQGAPDAQRLFFAGEQLLDRRRLGDYNIRMNSVLDLAHQRSSRGAAVQDTPG
eukprot:Hpha_TRINITY_DN16536_c0_g1::TRINITY_DN16536_c0_g1_i2::g.135881::m.135881